ncbi:MAG: peptidylprolyl isomerase [Arenimonas sp.]
MSPIRISILAAAIALASTAAIGAFAADAERAAQAAKSKPMAEILEQSPAADWRPLDPENTYYMELPGGRVVFELAPEFAPLHAQNIRTLAREKYFDGLAIIRAQDNYVVQWGDPEEDDKKAKPLGSAQPKLASEFTAPLAADKHFSKLPDGDVYAPEVGFSNGFPVGHDPKAGQAWLTHCYGAVGVARGTEEGTGTGSSLYVIISHAPRQLDRNIAVVGRVVQGMEMLAAMPRGPGPMGFYDKPGQRTPIASLRLAADVPAAERSDLEVLRTDSKTFADVTEFRRNRRDDFYIVPAGHVELCNVPLPVRAVKR